MSDQAIQLVEKEHPALRTVSLKVSDFTDIPKISAAMIEVMKTNKGVGLAAPQVGLSIRLFVMHPDIVFVNPSFVSASGFQDSEEGCLTLPGVVKEIKRRRTVKIEAQDAQGVKFTKTYSNLEAAICQHEMDHLIGKMITDY